MLFGNRYRSGVLKLPADFGAYRLIGILGEGGMARVYDGHRLGPRGFRKAVAIKVVKEAGPVAREDLLREAQLASSVRHPNVVDVLDVGEFEGTPYFVMERVDGHTLQQLLADGALPVPDALDVLLQIAAGLAALHDAGIVHRDAKPANVLVDHTGRVRLVDFGISEPVGSRVRARWGTLNYMSPEQAAGEFVGAPGDVFAFGALLVEVLCGFKLWDLHSVDQAAQVLNDPEPRLAEVRAAVDVALPGAGAVLARCLESHPARRYPDGHALWRALDALGDVRDSTLVRRIPAKTVAPPASRPPPPQPEHPAWAVLRLGLGVFRGGFTLEDGVAVLEAAGVQAPWLGISQLAEAGDLVRTGDRLTLVGREMSLSPVPKEIRQAHAEHFARMGGDEWVAWLRGPRASELKTCWLDEQHNLLSALQWAMDHGHPQAWQLARALHHVVRVGGQVEGLDALTMSIDEPRTRLAQARAWSTSGRDGAAARQLDGLLQRPLEPLTKVQVLIHLARALLSQSKLGRSKELADQAVELADRHHFRDLMVRAMRLQAVLLRRRGRYAEALALLAWCRVTCRALADEYFLARVEAVTGLICMDARRLDPALSHAQRSVDLLEESPDRLALGTQLGNLALIQRRAGLVRASHDNLRRSLTLFEQAGRVIEAQHIFSTLGSTLHLMGEMEEAERANQRSVELARSVVISALPGALGDLGCCRMAQGRFDEAEQLMDEALELSEQLGVTLLPDLLRLNRLALELDRGDLEAADTQVRVLHARKDELGPGLYGVLEMLMGRLAAATGRPQQALVLLSRAIVDVEGLDFEVGALAQLERAAVLEQLGRGDEVDLDDLDAWLEREGIGESAALARMRARLDEADAAGDRTSG